MTIVLEPVDLHAAAESLSDPLEAARARVIHLGEITATPGAAPKAADRRAEPPAHPAEGAAVVAPADDHELAAMLPWLEEQGVPPLVLLGGPRVLRVHEPGVSYVSSTGEVLLEGADACVLACGAQVGEALAAALDLHTQSIRIEVVSLSTLAPLDTELVCRSAERHPALLVAEAPPPDGIRGLHARVCDALGGREVAAVSRPPDRAEGREGRSEDRSEDRLAGPTAADIRAAVTRLTGEIDTKPVRPGETP